MSFTNDQIAELELLLLFPDNSLMQGIKIHNDAEPSKIEAGKRLFAKGIITQTDGGYLTELGYDLLKYANILKLALK
ncbi:TIGR02647 family protein [Opacimonas viscosa]|uniref:TIGR02647 family protein n=1 Tax=Opacimonas viscosa TaxID=2961944 RepID=A0AA42BM86_9ALTE|nr:TIGR02647 family protein [Opacimonas viscosa]MCP3429728.1 TIGR02647 family protein [Opacimonas viscosa]